MPRDSRPPIAAPRRDDALRPLTVQEIDEVRAEMLRRVVEGEHYLVIGRGPRERRYRIKLTMGEAGAVFGLSKTTVHREVVKARARVAAAAESDDR